MEIPHRRIAKALSTIKPWTSLSGDALTDISKKCRFAGYERGRQIIGYLEETMDVFFVVSGTVRVSIHSMLGKEISYREMGPGSMFGELAAIDGEQRSASVMAHTDAVLVAMPQAVFRQALRVQPVASEDVLQHLTCLVRLYSRRLYELRALDVSSRVRAELLRLAIPSEEENNTATIDPAPTHSTIANRVLTRREAVARELSSLARRGLIERNAKALFIRDISALKAMVDRSLGE
jgi:CRP/FNR family cyclic AMP-dependent transcriptional regulator